MHAAASALLVHFYSIICMLVFRRLRTSGIFVSFCGKNLSVKMPFNYKNTSIFASLPRTERAHSYVLGGDPKGKNFLYAHDTNIFIRNLEDPAICEVYSEHSAQATVAKYSPTGFYIASGDASGKIRIWDTTQKEHLLKYEYQPLSGKINDIVWSPDSKRIAVCGQGREKYAAAFLWDSGSKVGDLDSNTSFCNSLDYKQTRPYRVVVASEDMSTAFYEGPPFKHSKQFRDHTNFVNTVRYSPDGNFFASGSSDGKVFIYSGKEGELVTELKDGKQAHNGGVYSVCYSPDSTRLLTASADKSVKLWDAESYQLITTFVMGTSLEDQQLSCLWQGDYILSGSLSGFINYLDKNNPSTPIRIIRGHNKNITAVALSEDRKAIYSAGMDNKVLCWNSATSDCDVTTGKGHTNMVTGMSTNGSIVASVGMDDKVRFIDTEKKEFTEDVIGLDKQPLSVSTNGDKMVVGTVEEICVFKSNCQVSTEKIGYRANSVHFSPSGSQLAVGGDDSKVHIFNVTDNGLKEVDQLTTAEPVDAVMFSPNGEHIACNGNKKVLLWKVEGYTPISTYWSGHCGRITSLDWSPDSKRFATVGVDSSIGVWDLAETKTNNIIRVAHPKQVIVDVKWLDNDTIVSLSHDKCIKQWAV